MTTMFYAAAIIAGIIIVAVLLIFRGERKRYDAWERRVDEIEQRKHWRNK